MASMIEKLKYAKYNYLIILLFLLLLSACSLKPITPDNIDRNRSNNKSEVQADKNIQANIKKANDEEKEEINEEDNKIISLLSEFKQKVGFKDKLIKSFFTRYLKINNETINEKHQGYAMIAKGVNKSKISKAMEFFENKGFNVDYNNIAKSDNASVDGFISDDFICMLKSQQEAKTGNYFSVVCSINNNKSTLKVSQEKEIAEALAKKYAKNVTDLIIDFNFYSQTHATGQVKFRDDNTMPKNFYTVKDTNAWIVIDSSSISLCSDLHTFNFPQEIQQGCASKNFAATDDGIVVSGVTKDFLSKEEKENEAVELAKNYLTNHSEFKGGAGLQLLKIAEEDCENCWNVEFSFSRNDLANKTKMIAEIDLKDWEISSSEFKKSISINDCFSEEGHLINMASYNACRSGETMIGKIIGKSTNYYCCKF